MSAANDDQQRMLPNARTPTLRRNAYFWIPIVVCAAIHAAIFLGIVMRQPEYLRNYRLNAKPDARHYVLEGRNTWLLGHFSRCSAEPFVPDILRTPVYPVFAGLLDLSGGPAALYFVQSALNVACCGLIFLMTERIFTTLSGFVAAMLLATDLMVAISAFEAMSEILFMFFLLGAVLVLIRKDIGDRRNPTLQQCSLSGLLLSAATLTRPAGLYAVIVIAVLLVGQALATGDGRRGFVAASAMLFVFALPVFGWIARNKVVFDLPKLSIQDAIMTVYFTGAGAYQVEYGLSLEAAQDRIAKEYDLPPSTVTNNHWTTDMSVKEIDRRLRAAQFPVLTKYPVALVQSSLIGLVKSHISHNANVLGHLLAIPWNSSGAHPVQQTRLSRLYANNALLVAVFVWQMLHALVAWTLFAVGSIVLWRSKDFRWPTVLLAGLLAYMLLTVAIVGKDAYYRSRTPHMPFVYVIAGASTLILSKRKAEL